MGLRVRAGCWGGEVLLCLVISPPQLAAPHH